jgi:hypothetical protein
VSEFPCFCSRVPVQPVRLGGPQYSVRCMLLAVTCVCVCVCVCRLHNRTEPLFASVSFNSAGTGCPEALRGFPQFFK